MDEKKDLRKKIQAGLSGISRPLYEDLSYRIANRLYNDEMWESASTIGITISRMPEVETLQVVRKAWEQGKRVTVPKCEPQTKGLDFRELKHFSELESVFFGLLEPIPSETEKVLPSEIDLVIVPGLAFSNEGFRLGFGGGYYDRFLENYKGNTLSLAFRKQLVSNVPIEAHDIPVDRIITEDGVIIIGN
ncbi:5-formyltetrahydrofolate cyclo-ligase [Bacillus sp. REN3]|uniref:5-formyltetrahydrofolate cyclo-ligase n=1 Tax=Bacillus sp. REN3 TaxID=2802440 RepID=UPI001AEDBB89|nr:5-formyltetrahydrofolate cyclo-ligase [Bacillus sp. REN3]